MRAAFVAVTAVMVLSFVREIGYRFGESCEVSVCAQTTMFLLASYFLEARAGGRREARDHGWALRGERLKQICACSPSVGESENNLK